jgi:hypothetical protein
MFNRVPLLAIVCASAAFMGCGAQADSEGSSEDSLTASGESVGVAKQLVCPVDTQTCHPIDNSGDFCAQSNWTFESSPMHFWNNSAETNSALSNARHQGATGSWSLKVTPSSDPLHFAKQCFAKDSGSGRDSGKCGKARLQYPAQPAHL